MYLALDKQGNKDIILFDIGLYVLFCFHKDRYIGSTDISIKKRGQNMDTYRLERDIKVESGYDLVVAGAGPAGCAAAIAAGRLGAKVLLIEAMGCLGGLATAGIVSEFDPMANGEIMVVGGIMREIVEAMYERGFMPDCCEPQRWRKDHHRYTSFNAEGLKLLLDELVLGANVEIRFFTRVIDADLAGEGKVKGIIIQNVEGYRDIETKTFVDATRGAAPPGPRLPRLHAACRTPPACRPTPAVRVRGATAGRHPNQAFARQAMPGAIFSSSMAEKPTST
ncbi:MAG: FAD-dependent oxidoreductase [Eggerthellaceae bacterium]|nr:FAD-dependent oxidoreductase [Eggerthellaceae bacterium]